MTYNVSTDPAPVPGPNIFSNPWSGHMTTTCRLSSKLWDSSDPPKNPLAVHLPSSCLGHLWQSFNSASAIKHLTCFLGLIWNPRSRKWICTIILSFWNWNLTQVSIPLFPSFSDATSFSGVSMSGLLCMLLVSLVPVLCSSAKAFNGLVIS